MRERKIRICACCEKVLQDADIASLAQIPVCVSFTRRVDTQTALVLHLLFIFGPHILTKISEVLSKAAKISESSLELSKILKKWSKNDKMKKL